MDYMTGIENSPVYEFPYSGNVIPPVPFLNNDVDSILASIAPPSGGTVYNQLPPLDGIGYNQFPSFTLQCVPQISSNIGNNATVYQVPENVPLEAILQQFGVDPRTLQQSGSLDNYYRSMSQPRETIANYPYNRRRRLICDEIPDSEDDFYYRNPPQRPRRNSDSWSSQPQQPPPNIHNLLANVWNRAERATRNLPPSSSMPNLNSQWQSRSYTPPPPQPQPPPISQAQQNAVSNVWNKADAASRKNTNFIGNVFSRMRQPTGKVVQTPQNQAPVPNFFAPRNPPYGLNQPPPPQNREAVGNFFATRNLPYGLNQPPPPQNIEAQRNFIAARNLPYGPNQPPPPRNIEAERNFIAARNLPYGLNQPPPPPRYPPYGVNLSPPPPQNREAVQDFFAARNLPYGINTSPPPPPNREAVQDFFAARNLPYGINTSPPPPPNQEAVQDFFAARNLPYGINRPNTAVANVWNRADRAAFNTAPPMYNTPWNQSPPPSPSPMLNRPWNQMQSPLSSPLNSPWNHMLQNPSYSQNPANILAPFAGPIRPPTRVSAPQSFGSILAQAHSQHLPYAGAI